LAFEQAAALRDKRDALRWLREQLDRLPRARERLSFVYPVAGTDGRALWYLIHGGHTRAVVLPPSDAPSGQAASSAIEAVFPGKASPAGTIDPDKIDGVLLVTSWFRRHPEERKKTLTPAEALVRCAKAAPSSPPVIA